MATQKDVRRIALSLPDVVENDGRFAFSVVDKKGKPKGFAWAWNERVHPKKARVPNPNVLVLRVADEVEKQTLLAADDEKFFTEPHYDGYPAILVRLASVNASELRDLLTAAWQLKSGGRGVATVQTQSAKKRSRKPEKKRSTK